MLCERMSRRQETKREEEAREEDARRKRRQNVTNVGKMPAWPPTVFHCRGFFSFIVSSSCFSYQCVISLVTSSFSYHVLHLFSSSSPGCFIDPLGGAQGPPYGVSLSWFLFIHLVIVLLVLSSFNFSYHVGLLLSRLAFVAPVEARGGPINTEGYFNTAWWEIANVIQIHECF